MEKPMLAKQIQKSSKCLALFLSLASILSAPMACQAQLGFGASKYTKKENFDDGELLRAKVSLNSVPDYSGRSTFIVGRRHKTDAGVSTVEEFFVMEPSAQVVQWYKNSLPGYQWEILKSDKQSVSAQRADGASLRVSAVSIQSPKGRTRLKITFAEHH
jgi:hypothetical protein